MYSVAFTNLMPIFAFHYASGETFEEALKKALSKKFPKTYNVVRNYEFSEKYKKQPLLFYEIIDGNKEELDFSIVDTDGKRVILKEDKIPNIVTVEANVIPASSDNPKSPLTAAFVKKYTIGYPKRSDLKGKYLFVLVRPKFIDNLFSELDSMMTEYFKKNKDENTLEFVFGTINEFLKMLYDKSENFSYNFRLLSSVMNAEGLRQFALIEGVNGLKFDYLSGTARSYSHLPFLFRVQKEGLNEAEALLFGKYLKAVVEMPSVEEFITKVLKIDLKDRSELKLAKK